MTKSAALTRLTALLTLALSLASMTPARAESTDEALEWLKRMSETRRDRAFTVDYAMEMGGGSATQGMEYNLEGQMTQADPTRFRMSVTLDMGMPGMAQRMNMAVDAVSDGEIIWLEMSNPMAGGKQVMKMPLDAAEKLSQLGGPGQMSQMASVDPFGQIEDMASAFDFEVVGQDEQTVTLKAVMNESTRSKLGQSLPFDASAVDEFRMVLDRQNALPKEVFVGGAAPLMKLSFENLEFLDRASLAPEQFTYEPPAGASVMDLEAMLNSMAGMGGR